MMGPLGCPETLLTTNLHCIKSQTRKLQSTPHRQLPVMHTLMLLENIVKQMQQGFKSAEQTHAPVCMNMPTFIPRPSFV